MNQAECPTPSQILDFVLGKLTPIQHQQLASHFEDCVSCRQAADQAAAAEGTLVRSPPTSQDSDSKAPEMRPGAAPVNSTPASNDTSANNVNDATIVYNGSADTNTSVSKSAETRTLSSQGTPGDGQVGDLPEVFGRYRIIELLGKGGMGAVYLAQDTELDRKLAIKIPFAEGDKKATVLDRFRREARSVAQIHHPNICPIYDVSEINGTHYMSMAFIEGKPLNEFIRPDRPLSVRQVVSLVRVLASALQHAHDVGVIHRDLKPANILIDKKNHPVIMDFGLARREGTADTQLTQAGQIMGTPDYMSPEQVSGVAELMGPKCDIYSLGVILYQLLTGRRPFEGDLLALLSAIANQEPDPPSKHREQLDGDLDAICLKALAKKPEDRFDSMKEFANALQQYSRGKGISKSETTSPQSDPNLPAPVPNAIPAHAATSPTAPTSQGLVTSLAIESPTRASERIAAVKRRKEPGKRIPTWQWLAVGGIAVSLLALLAVIVLLLPAQDGTLRIEVSNPAIRVAVNGKDGFQVQGREGEFEIAPGNHTLQIKAQGADFESKPFTVESGEETALRVILFAGKKVQVFDGNKLLDERDISSPSTDESTDTLNGDEQAGDNKAEENQNADAGNPIEPLGKDIPALPTLPGSFKAVAGANNALLFDKDNDYNGGVDLNLGQVGAWPRAMTIECFVETNQNAADYAMFAKLGHFSISVAQGWGANVGTIRLDTQDNLPLGQWAHLAAVFDGQELRLYIDGKLAAKSNDPGLKEASPNVPLVGKLGVRGFLGRLDEIRISAVARYEADFTPIKTEQRFETDEHTLALYHCNKGEGDVLLDSSEREHHGKISGGKWVANGSQADSGSSSVADLDRTAAEWVLGIQGAISTADGDFTSIDRLPEKPFQVTRIDLKGNQKVTEEGLRNLQGLLGLTSVEMHGSSVTDDGLPHLAELPHLRQLILTDTKIGDEGIAHLQTTKLTELHVRNTLITDNGLQSIQKMPLELLYIRGSQTTPGGLEALGKKMPGCVID